MVVPEEGFKLLCTIFLLSSIPQTKSVGFNYDGTQTYTFAKYSDNLMYHDFVVRY